MDLTCLHCLIIRMSFSMGCFFLMTGALSCAVARGCENVCCLTLFQIPFYFGMLFCSMFIPNSASSSGSRLRHCLLHRDGKRS